MTNEKTRSEILANERTGSRILTNDKTGNDIIANVDEQKILKIQKIVEFEMNTINSNGKYFILFKTSSEVKLPKLLYGSSQICTREG